MRLATVLLTRAILAYQHKVVVLYGYVDSARAVQSFDSKLCELVGHRCLSPSGGA
jgi:hypothetical protein